MTDLGRIEGVLAEEYRFLVGERRGWSLVEAPQDLELVAHVLRVLLHTGTLRDFRDEYAAVAACQHRDGGWGARSDAAESAVWVSAFCALMLLRGNRFLAEETLTAAVRRAIDYFLDLQHGDGRWVDRGWADLDATSHPISFLNVALALGEGHRRAEVERAWRRGLGFILEAQGDDGGWRDAVHPSGVEITAHLIQDALAADLLLGERVPGTRRACAKGLTALRAWQGADGSWDDGNVDHTMDCVRSSMVVSRALAADLTASGTIETGLAWILASKNRRGWGDFRGRETNLERTCDGIDTLCKYLAFRTPDPHAVIRLWGYVP